MPDYETHIVDVLIIGAGGAGLRAAVDAAAPGSAAPRAAAPESATRLPS
ncbi:MAG TPA: hypothetical protein VMD59_10275 [Acidimicrobiales bacterium]|nr:hypothetical protein [Acidimicrobiales bacterium]